MKLPNRDEARSWIDENISADAFASLLPEVFRRVRKRGKMSSLATVPMYAPDVAGGISNMLAHALLDVRYAPEDMLQGAAQVARAVTPEERRAGMDRVNTGVLNYAGGLGGASVAARGAGRVGQAGALYSNPIDPGTLRRLEKMEMDADLVRRMGDVDMGPPPTAAPQRPPTDAELVRSLQASAMGAKRGVNTSPPTPEPQPSARLSDLAQEPAPAQTGTRMVFGMEVPADPAEAKKFFANMARREAAAAKRAADPNATTDADLVRSLNASAMGAKRKVFANDDATTAGLSVAAQSQREESARRMREALAEAIAGNPSPRAPVPPTSGRPGEGLRAALSEEMRKVVAARDTSSRDAFVEGLRTKPTKGKRR